MKVIAIIGSLGSGKTTLVNNLLASGVDFGTTLVIVNDIGKVNVDAQRIKTVGEIRPLTAGCIGCSDLPAFLAILSEAKVKAIETVIIEPTGIADGKEIRDALNRADVIGKILSLYDVRHAKRNHALGVIESQLKEADMIGLTWHEHLSDLKGLINPRLEETLKRIGNSSNKEVVLVSKDTLPRSVIARLLDDTNTPCPTPDLSKWVFTPPHQVKNFVTHCSHRHGDHGVYTVTISLREDLTLAELAEAMAPHINTLVRAKGVLGKRRFDLVQGSFEFGEVCNAEPFGNFIATRAWEESAFVRIAVEKTEKRETKKGLMRKHASPLEDTLIAIQWLLCLYSEAGIISSSGKLRVDWEADAAYQLSLRDRVPDEVKATVVKNFVRQRLDSLILLSTRKWEVSAEELSYWKRRLGINLCYFSFQYPEFVGDDLLQDIEIAKPVKTLVEGLLGLTQLGFNDELAEERPELVKQCLNQGLNREEITQNQVDQVLTHCQTLAADNETWLARWK